ncbi:Formylmethanofuran dehydrogenase, subunit E domain protein [Acididesulfobacillus acetoxydans]|uniref:FmdE, Molybdenum formylmethanofuran dehydrogenase operon protein n=1 Tax=Acididesulfobacillus acetoxydans TaxID=1561005 RepID=A0A8S0XBR2_9FIRM|nr:FmdE family protein [Acididesulfobacillus acetoxydans]CAA7601526.1 Formylmethanofuran dehydrogenase, subunit E domain protein [Acididesulfobacillus acetoxydans]CEJ07013.1 FmdE, Molybdenum formylmethanofuran dehydrogenase operon protein [Acididesulfobacillus acetoxydans]
MIEIKNETPITDEELKGAQFFHGHICPAMPQGLRAGHLAMDILGVKRARTGGELMMIVEIGDNHFSGCLADGLQYSTGCTFGKSNIVKKPLGKFAFTLIDPKTKRAVRVSAKHDRMKTCLTMPFFEERKKGIPPYDLDPNVVLPLIEDTRTRDWHEMFDVTLFENYPVVKAGETFEAEQCHECKEMVVTNYAQKLGEDWYCQTCFDALTHRKQED